MSTGFQRLNARKSQPNPYIVFIKPLKGPDEAVAQEFLERIAAQCVPIMREHNLHVMTLEEYEPNREFVGRNFNAGEVIQLVLKSRGRSGRWLPFPYVQMVMMHELAHCRQMNHSRAFWSVRDAYAAQMRRLWSANYTGEGIWGRGARLGEAGQGRPVYERNMATPGEDDDVLLEHLCGGTYQSKGGRRRKQKNKKPVLSYQEQKERRIRRKFGVNGMELGGDVEERAKLEGPGNNNHPNNKRRARVTLTSSDKKRVAVKPRVAVSKRGRELRAAAALARFEQNQKEKTADDVKEEGDEGDGDDADYDDDALSSIKGEEEADSNWDSDDTNEDDEDDSSTIDLTGPDAVDIDGTRMVDGEGHGMVRVCEGDSLDGDVDAKRELRELLQTSSWAQKKKQPAQPAIKSEQAKSRPISITKRAEPLPTMQKPPPQPSRALQPNSITPAVQPSAPPATRKPSPAPAVKREVKGEREGGSEPSLAGIPRASARTDKCPPLQTQSDSRTGVCPICSYANDQMAVTCAICMHVLKAAAAPGAWQCRSAVCQAREGVQFLNSGDNGVCAVCGERKA